MAVPRYGWLGGRKRSGEDLAGLTLMGVRLYNPLSGRFLQTDPIPGGNANAYGYPEDPINSFDLDGRMRDTGDSDAAYRQRGYQRQDVHFGRSSICEYAGVVCSKGGKQRIRDSGLKGLSDQEIKDGARDNRLPGPIRQKYKKEEKARGLRHTGNSFHVHWPTFHLPFGGGGCGRGDLACTR